MFLTKFDGRKEKFDPEKIVQACTLVGCSPDTAQQISETITRRSPQSSSDIHSMILETVDAKAARLLMQRDAIARLDAPSFEMYVRRVLEGAGYKCKWNVMIQGKCVEHQIDVLAQKGDKTYVVECKHHRNQHRYMGLDTALEMQARIEDLGDYSAWIVTNTKFSDHAKQYARKKGILLSGWKHDQDISLEKLITHRTLPVTVLKVSEALHRAMIKNNIITLGDVESADRSLLDNLCGKETQVVLSQL